MHFILSLLLFVIPPPGPVTLYAAPNVESAVVAELPAGESLTLTGRTDAALWVYAEVTGGPAGWVPTTAVLSGDDDVFALPVIATQTVTLDPALIDRAEAAGIQVELEQLATTPLLHNFDAERIAAIHADGITLGNNPRIFIKVGDSNTTTGDFLRPMGMRDGGCDYGPFAGLQVTVAHYSENPRERFDDSWDSTHVTAQNGLNTAGLLDPFWAPGDICQPGETPLDCETRILEPSAAIVMIGLMDLEQVPVTLYRENLTAGIQDLLDKGVVPILTTFTVLPDYPAAPPDSLWEKSVELNAAILDVAETTGVPVINLWAALQPLPDFGIGPDRVHLRHEMGAFCAYTGEEQTIGGTLRNLLTLQAFDRVRQASTPDD